MRVREEARVPAIDKQTTYKKRENTRERFSWFDDVPTFMVKENSQSVYYFTLKFRVISYIIYIIYFFLAHKKYWYKDQNNPDPKPGT